MHPYLHEQLMAARSDDLRRRAAHSRHHRLAVRPARRPLRRDVGWLLVNLGLRLAVGPAAAQRTSWGLD